MKLQKFVGTCPTCEMVCLQIEEPDGWFMCFNCSWIWEPKDKRDMTDRIICETVDHPAHYGQGIYEAINVIEAWDLGFNLGNAVKYIARAGKKGDYREDLEKAIWYLQREVAYSKWEPKPAPVWFDPYQVRDE